MALPICVFLLFGTIHALRVLYNVVTRRKRGTSCRKQLYHAVTMKSASLLMFYVLYLYLVRTVLSIFNCVPTNPPDGQLYLAVSKAFTHFPQKTFLALISLHYSQTVFVPCGVPGGLQMTLMPWAVMGIIIYVLGYPAFLGQVSQVQV